MNAKRPIIDCPLENLRRGRSTKTYPRKGKLNKTKNHAHQVKTTNNINALALKIHRRKKLTPKKFIRLENPPPSPPPELF